MGWEQKKLLPSLSQYWNLSHKRYLEPFMGSASLFFNLLPAKAILSDINDQLIETFIIVRDTPKELYQSIIQLPHGEKSYYYQRDLSPQNLAPIERAARFIFLNRYCFNGLYRTNLSGKFNVPYSSSNTGSLPSLERLNNASKALNSVSIYCSDFESILLANVREGDFIYLDPPYAKSNGKIFSSYGPGTFQVTDLERMGSILEVINSRNADFVLSYAYCKEALSAFGRWNLNKKLVQRNIAGFSKHRRKVYEMIVSNINVYNE